MAPEIEVEVIGQDQRGVDVVVGSILLDDRGRLWRVEPTEGTIRAQRIARVVELRYRRHVLTPVGQSTMQRMYWCFVVQVDDLVAGNPMDENQAMRTRWFSAIFETYVRQAQRAQIDARRRYANAVLVNAGVRAE